MVSGKRGIRHENILIVDDSALMRRVLSDIIDDNKELNAAYLAEDGVEARKF